MATTWYWIWLKWHCWTSTCGFYRGTMDETKDNICLKFGVKLWPKQHESTGHYVTCLYVWICAADEIDAHLDVDCNVLRRYIMGSLWDMDNDSII